MSTARQAVLIAGFSGRALAAAARRAGYVPLVADAFGDIDTRAIAAGVRVFPAAVETGFTASKLVAALDELATAAPSPPIGLVLGAGFEDTPGLVAKLASRFPLLGCSSETIARSKDPQILFGLLAELGIAHPETRREPPPDGRGWLSKRTGGSGGTHIALCGREVTGEFKDRYYQRRIDGEAISMLGVVRGRRAAFAFTRQWAAPMPRRPYRFGGVAGAIDVDADLEARLVDIGLDLSGAFGLTGLVSLDFVVSKGEPHLVEINPRPGASLDVLDDDRGTLFSAHIAACRGEDPVGVLAESWRPEPSAAAYVYADTGDLVVPAIDWPHWTSDRPASGARIARYHPVATVRATASTIAEAMTLVEARSNALAAMLHPL